MLWQNSLNFFILLFIWNICWFFKNLMLKIKLNDLDRNTFLIDKRVGRIYPRAD